MADLSERLASLYADGERLDKEARAAGRDPIPFDLVDAEGIATAIVSDLAAEDPDHVAGLLEPYADSETFAGSLTIDILDALGAKVRRRWWGALMENDRIEDLWEEVQH